MCADGEVMEEMRESHRGMVEVCRWNGGGMEWDTNRLPLEVLFERPTVLAKYRDINQW